MSQKTLIGIAGGIGSGKSVVARMLRATGRKVYDCDSEARRLMNDDDTLRRQLSEAFGNDIYGSDGMLDRKRLAALVFTDSDNLQRINALVHPAVGRDIARWTAEQSDTTLWVETAILRESGLDSIVDRAWLVEAPLEVRIERAMRRDGTTRDKVLERIESQRCDKPYHCPTDFITNDGLSALTPQIAVLTRRAENIIDSENEI